MTCPQHQTCTDETGSRARSFLGGLFRPRRAVTAPAESLCPPAGARPDSAAGTPPWALPPWQYRPGWDD